MKDIFLIACDVFHKELQHIIEIENYHNIKLFKTEANCGTMKSLDNSECLKSDPEYTSETLCLPLHTNCLDEKCILCEHDLSVSDESNCYSLLLADEIVSYFIQRGYYIVAPGWLFNWQHYVIDLWGFNQVTAKLFFKDSASKILILDTGVYEDIIPKAEEFASFAGIGYELLPVGIDHFKSTIDRIVIEKQNKKISKKLETSKGNFQKQTANQFLLFDFINRISDFKDEQALINDIINLSTMLFAPKFSCYIMIDSNMNSSYYSLSKMENQRPYDNQLEFDGG